VTELASERWSWTVETYEQAAGAGVFGDEPRVELLDGEVYQVSPMRPGHAAACRAIYDLISPAIDRARWTLGSQQPVLVDPRSEPEPDLWVAVGPRARYVHRHPVAADLALVVEVSDTSLRVDRAVKVPMYARAGVPEVWIVSLPERVVHAHTRPEPTAGRYGTVRTSAPDATLTAEALGLHLAVDAMLPAGR
jgi:Uma2 family endonuclease